MRHATRIGVLISALFLAPAAHAQQDPLAEIDAFLNTSATAEQTLARASEATEAGDLTGAATILERYLLVDPNEISVRAAYVACLCELDDMPAAAFEAAKLSRLTLDGQQRASISAVCPAGGPVIAALETNGAGQ